MAKKTCVFTELVSARATHTKVWHAKATAGHVDQQKGVMVRHTFGMLRVRPGLGNFVNHGARHVGIMRVHKAATATLGNVHMYGSPTVRGLDPLCGTHIARYKRVMVVHQLYTLLWFMQFV